MKAKLFAHPVRLLAAAILAAAASSCDAYDEPLLPTEPSLGVSPGQTYIEVRPAGPLTLLTGDTITLQATAVGTFSAMRYETSDSTVVTVEDGGLVTAMGPGAAQVVISLRTLPSIRAVVSIVVLSRGPSAIALRSVSAVDGSPLREGPVRGRFLAQLEFSRGDAVGIDIVLDTVPACFSALAPQSAAAPSGTAELGSCVIDTAAFDSVTGVPRFPNGTYSMRARLLGSRGRVLANSEPPPGELSNVDTVYTRIVPDARFVDARGRVWLGGNVRADAVPVTYIPGHRITAAEFRYVLPSGGHIAVSDSLAPYSATFRRAAVGEIVDEDFEVEVTSFLRGGGLGPSGRSDMYWYDAVAPAPGSVTPIAWAGANFDFATLFSAAAERDRGVGGLTVDFFAGTPFESPAEILARGTRVRVGGDLPASAPGAYRLLYRVCDAVGNCVAQPAFTFGVDLVGPTLRATNMPPRVVNPTTDLWMSPVDDRSGLLPVPLRPGRRRVRSSGDPA
jgi:hypothetical protein